MSAEWVAIILTAVCMFCGLIGQALYITWHASRWNTTLEFMTLKLQEVSNALTKMDGHYTKAEAKDDFGKRDELMQKLWKKQDDLKDDFVLLRGKVDAHLLKQEGNHDS